MSSTLRPPQVRLLCQADGHGSLHSACILQCCAEQQAQWLPVLAAPLARPKPSASIAVPRMQLSPAACSAIDQCCCHSSCVTSCPSSRCVSHSSHHRLAECCLPSMQLAENAQLGGYTCENMCVDCRRKDLPHSCGRQQGPVMGEGAGVQGRLRCGSCRGRCGRVAQCRLLQRVPRQRLGQDWCVACFFFSQHLAS